MMCVMWHKIWVTWHKSWHKLDNDTAVTVWYYHLTLNDIQLSSGVRITTCFSMIQGLKSPMIRSAVGLDILWIFLWGNYMINQLILQGVGTWVGIWFFIKHTFHSSPSKEFELTANTLWAHMKTHASSFWSHSSTSQRTHKMSSHCELAVSPPWVCNSHHELAVSYSWDQSMSSPCSGSSSLTHCDLTANLTVGHSGEPTIWVWR